MHIPHFAHLFTIQFLKTHLSPHVKLGRLHTKSRGLVSPESRSPDDSPQVTGAVAEAHVPLDPRLLSPGPGSFGLGCHHMWSDEPSGSLLSLMGSLPGPSPKPRDSPSLFVTADGPPRLSFRSPAPIQGHHQPGILKENWRLTKSDTQADASLAHFCRLSDP